MKKLTVYVYECVEGALNKACQEGGVLNFLWDNNLEVVASEIEDATEEETNKALAFVEE